MNTAEFIRGICAQKGISTRSLFIKAEENPQLLSQWAKKETATLQTLANLQKAFEGFGFEGIYTPASAHAKIEALKAEIEMLKAKIEALKLEAAKHSEEDALKEAE